MAKQQIKKKQPTIQTIVNTFEAKRTVVNNQNSG